VFSTQVASSWRPDQNACKLNGQLDTRRIDQHLLAGDNLAPIPYALIETAEADSWEEIQRDIRPEFQERFGITVRRIGGAVVVAEALPRTALEHGPTVAAATGPPELDSPHSGVPEGTLAPVTTWSAEAPKQLRTYFGI